MFEIKKSDKLTLFYESRRLENKFRTGRESLTSSTRLVAFLFLLCHQRRKERRGLPLQERNFKSSVTSYIIKL